MSSEKREIRLAVRFTEKEYDTLKKLSRKSQITRAGKPCVSQYIRKLVLDTDKIVVIEDLRPVLTELKRIGTNINQIAKLANMGQIKTAYLEETQNALNQIVKKIMLIVEKV